MSVASVPQLLQEVETSKVFHWPTSAHSLVERLAAALEHTTVERDHACTLQTLAEEDRDALRAQREALRAAATKMVAKMDECATIIGSAFVCLQTSGYRNMASPAEYTGPTYNVELEALRAVLAQGKEP